MPPTANPGPVTNEAGRGPLSRCVRGPSALRKLPHLAGDARALQRDGHRGRAPAQLGHSATVASNVPGRWFGTVGFAMMGR